VEYLERDQPVVLEIAGEIDRGHPAPAELALEGVAVSQGVPEVGGAVGHREPITSVVQTSLCRSPTVK
jgi:hypothetical protein